MYSTYSSTACMSTIQQHRYLASVIYFVCMIFVHIYDTTSYDMMLVRSIICMIYTYMFSKYYRKRKIYTAVYHIIRPIVQSCRIIFFFQNLNKKNLPTFSLHICLSLAGICPVLLYTNVDDMMTLQQQYISIRSTSI